MRNPAKKKEKGAPAVSGPLGPLEREIMEALWALGGATGKDIYVELNKRRAAALTTVLTVLERLTKKGLVEKVPTKTVYIFKPAYSKEEFGRKVSGEVFKGVLEISSSSAIASFVDTLADIDPSELDRLKRLIDEKKKEMKGR